MTNEADELIKLYLSGIKDGLKYHQIRKFVEYSLIKHFAELGLTNRAIARKIGISAAKIDYLMRRHKLERKKRETKKTVLPKKKATVIRRPAGEGRSVPKSGRVYAGKLDRDLERQIERVGIANITIGDHSS